MFARLTSAVLLLALFGAPLTLPILEIARSSSFESLAEYQRLLALSATTVSLCALTIAICLPTGIAIAVALERFDLPGRRLMRNLLTVAMFVPLPVFAMAWQSVLGMAGQRWPEGVLAAATIHALAGLPWAVWLTSLGLARVEPELEEDALIVATPLRVLFRVTLRRALPGIGLATIWLAIQAAGEIVVTDMMLVRTYAEEVYTQFVAAGPDALGRAVAVSLPATVVSIGVVIFLTSLWKSRLGNPGSVRPQRMLSLGRYRRLAGVGAGALIAAYVGVPLIALLRQVGGESFTFARWFLEMKRATTLHVPMIADSVLWSLVAGFVAATTAVLCCWVSRNRRWHSGLLVALAIGLWAVPGPVLGFGLKVAIDWVIDFEEVISGDSGLHPLRAVLYDLSTPIPVLWAHLCRVFPIAVAIIWPAMREVPQALTEQAKIDGASPWIAFRIAAWPVLRRPWIVAGIAGAALALGELSASKVVQVPGRQTFVQELFNQMHYGVTATTASLVLVELALVGVVISLTAAIRRT